MRPRNNYEGIIVVDKPVGMTSHDVVAKTRRILNMKRIGHAGTLDPLATGVLIILVGRATKLFQKFENFDKGYLATLRLGMRTHSADLQGNVLEQKPYDHITQGQIEDAFKKYVGDIQQVPPMVSALKHKGRRLYELARRGIEVEREARLVRVDRLEVKSFKPPYVQFYLKCSKGTYVRQIADDVGEDLDCGACIIELKRTEVGPFCIDQAVSLECLNETDIRDWDDSLVEVVV